MWDKLDLSRSQFETLRHLLSFVYDPTQEQYKPTVVWKDENDPKVCVLACRLAPRVTCERLYNEIADAAGVVVSPVTGRCEQDCQKLTRYMNFKQAMRDDFSAERSAQPFFYVDGTGGSLGKGICHAEIGSAYFAGAKQLRATLTPVGLGEGTDHAGDLRENLPIAAASYNKLIAAGTIAREDGSAVPCRPGVSGDLQAVKAMAAQEERSHSPWCKDCHLSDTRQHCYGDANFRVANVVEMTAYIRDVMKCEMRDEKWMCAESHMSFGVHGASASRG
mmetsp:Transcript_13806/g.29915  ORF Transcript_13806/g.29915 Transcript_13806/m.29915 type:complete len:277 (+) Transcript_13806:201-1031(+)